MGEKSNKKYLIFPIIMLVFTIFATLIGHHINGINEYLEKYDVTGMTGIFMYAMFVIELVILSFCIYKGKKGLEEGYDYLFNKFACIIFVILTIIPIISFFIVRSGEENLAKEMESKFDNAFDQIVSVHGKNSKSSQADKVNSVLNYFETGLEDKYYIRKTEINDELKENKSKLEFFVKYFVFNRANYDYLGKTGYAVTMEERYYSIYSRMSIVNIVCLAFYVISLKDKRTNKMRNN